jgi:predicted phage-related endonuclease
MQHISGDVKHNRSAGIGGSDAKMIISGEWHKLWLLKTNREEQEDLSDVFPVQLGSYTESFHAEWFAKRTGFTLADPQPFYIHPTDEWMYAHLDYWIPQEGTFVELKHSNGSATCRDKAEYYMPQMAHYAHVLGLDSCWFSVIPGNLEPDFGRVELNADYIANLVDLERAFWWHVVNDVAPDIIPTAKIAAVQKAASVNKIDGLRKYDFNGNNQWASLARECIDLKPAAQRFDVVTKELKAMTPEDSAETVGHGIVIKRDKAGRLRITEKE